jgi:hypothetical protein
MQRLKSLIYLAGAVGAVSFAALPASQVLAQTAVTPASPSTGVTPTAPSTGVTPVSPTTGVTPTASPGNTVTPSDVVPGRNASPSGGINGTNNGTISAPSGLWLPLVLRAVMSRLQLVPMGL